MCIIFYVLGVSMLTLQTQTLASQQLSLAMEQPGDEIAHSTSPTANTSQRQTQSMGKA